MATACKRCFWTVSARNRWCHSLSPRYWGHSVRRPGSALTISSMDGDVGNTFGASGANALTAALRARRERLPGRLVRLGAGWKDAIQQAVN